MIVYRHEGIAADGDRLYEVLERWRGRRGVDAARARLVELGAVEAALQDARNPERDDTDAFADRMRAALCAAAGAFVAALDGDRGRERRSCQRCSALVAAIDRAAIPRRVEIRPPEGFVQYGLFPDCYVAAARRALATLDPPRVVCLGLRSIGTTLSAAVAAAVAAAGIPVRSYTVRPRGRPGARELRLGSTLARALAADRDACFFVCDEGPGLSGSSFAAAARAPVEIGAARERVVLFPSYDCDGARFSDDVRRTWTSHRHFVVPFDPAIVARGPLVDISAGGWRARVFADRKSWPPVQPQHERRKYLGARRVYKFAGFGWFGAERVATARALAAAGFGPPVLGFRDGFVQHPWIDGAPATERSPGALVERVTAYLRWRRRLVAAERLDARALVEMARQNLGELGGAEAAGVVDRAARTALAAQERAGVPALILDARMQWAEWLAAPPLKLDGVDHGRDHFHPGPNDQAWDVAGARVELLPGAAGDALVARLARDDATLRARLPFYELAYLAWHLGYARLAMTTTNSDEGERWARRAAALAARLRQASFAAAGGP